MDLAQLALLRTPAGQQALIAAASLTHLDPLAAATTLRGQGFPPDLAAAALSQAQLRARARAKFGPAAAGMYFTRAGLEQATRAGVAARRATRLAAAGIRTLTDLGCGLGSDLRAATAAGIMASGVDIDPVTAACAALNAPDARVSCADVRDTDLSDTDAVFCDPARRSGGRRVFRPEDYSPPWDWVAGLPQRIPHTVLKLAPGIDQELLPAGCELELVSVDGDVVEAAAWCGPLAGAARRATLLRGAASDRGEVGSNAAAADPTVPAAVHELTGTGLGTAPVGPVGAYLVDPDGAVVRSHLVAELADLVSGRIGDPTIAYLWTDQPPRTPFGRCFAVDEVLPFSLKRLRAALRARDVGRVEILKRGSALDVEQLRRQLRLGGTESASVLLTRVAGAPVAVIATALPG